MQENVDGEWDFIDSIIVQNQSATLRKLPIVELENHGYPNFYKPSIILYAVPSTGKQH